MKPEVKELVRRGTSSRIASECRKMEFSSPVKITVSQNAPCCIQKDGCFPSRMGWKESDNLDIVATIEETRSSEVWIKTATLGGRRRMWVKRSEVKTNK